MVLAAGMGRRFGGDKQLTPVGPEGATLADYAVADARRHGAVAAVFVVRAGLLEAFKTHHRRWGGFPIHHVVQRIDQLPAGRSASGRTRPWGTAHAVLAGGPGVVGSCLVINADDYYGEDAIAAAARFLGGADPAVPTAGLVGYRLRDTLSSEGGVSRAVIEHTDGRVTGLSEVRDVAMGAGDLTGRSGDRLVSLTGDELVSMNCWAFTPALFPLLVRGFDAFLDRSPGDDEECALPDVISDLADQVPVRLLQVGTRWLGMTWPGDIPRVARVLSTVPAPFPAASKVN